MKKFLFTFIFCLFTSIGYGQAIHDTIYIVENDTVYVTQVENGNFSDNGKMLWFINGMVYERIFLNGVWSYRPYYGYYHSHWNHWLHRPHYDMRHHYYQPIHGIHHRPAPPTHRPASVPLNHRHHNGGSHRMRHHRRR